MDQLEGLRHQLDELTLTAKSRAKSATMVGYVIFIWHLIVFIISHF